MSRWRGYFESVARDVRFGLRLLARQPGFTLTVVAILAVGIGANATVFAWINATLLSPVPGARDTHDLVALARAGDRSAISYLDYLELREDDRAFTDLIAFQDTWTALTGDGPPRRVFAGVVSANYFDVLGATPIHGRGFLPGEDAVGEGTVVVLGHRLWTDRYQGDPGIVGRAIEIDHRRYTVVGIAPARFQGTKPAIRIDLWVPLSQANAISGGEHLRDRNDLWFNLIGRLRPGVERDRAAGAVIRWINAHAAEVGQPDEEAVRISAYPLWASPIGGNALFADVLGPLLSATIAVLVLACANVANLMLLRSLTRGRELAIRAAIGAGAGHIRRQVLVESTILALAAGAAAFLTTLVTARTLRLFLPPIAVPLEIGTTPDGGVLIAAFGVALIAGVGTGLMPALRAARIAPGAVLKEESAGAIGAVFRSRLVNAFVVVQIALSVVLLAGAGLLGRSVDNARRSDPGFDADRILVATFDLLPGSYSRERGVAAMREILERVEALPGVEAATVADWVPLSFGRHTSVVDPEGHTPARGESMEVGRADVGPTYFATLGIPLVGGRDFRDADGPEDPAVAIVNQTFADRYWPGRDPLGRRIRSNGRERVVVGVARDIRYFTWNDPALPFLYLPQLQHYYHEATLHVRTSGPPKDLATAVVAAIQAVDPQLPVYLVDTMAEQTRAAGFLARIAATTGGLLGFIALILATTGVYSVVARATRQRTREIGVRVALGAEPRDVLRLVLRRGMALTSAGLAIGLVAALGLTRFLGSQLYGVSRFDPIAFTAAVLLMGIVSGIACYIPGRKATRLEVARALHHD